MNSYDNIYLQSLKNEILKMTSIEWINIFNIIKEDNVPFTKNNNGVFVNMSDLNDKTIESINKIINYYKTINMNNKNREEKIQLINI